MAALIQIHFPHHSSFSQSFLPSSSSSQLIFSLSYPSSSSDFKLRSSLLLINNKVFIAALRPRRRATRVICSGSDSPARTFRSILDSPGVHQGPACFDALSAKLVEKDGFPFFFTSDHCFVIQAHPYSFTKDIPPLQIVMVIVGTLGDVQPFVAIVKRLQEDGHRVRLATHANFKDIVLTAGLDFFPLGGDPKVLAGYMVKNKGFFPSRPLELPVQRQQMREIIFSLLPACQDPDPETNIPFRAEVIIANPPAYGHMHVAEALKVPLHVIFTMPWTPTSEFSHPMSRVK
ncbi:Sterol 3-beta-glucosyltransferase UGT80A2 [Linum perenne]